MNELVPKVSGGEFLLYQIEDGQVRLDVRLQDETVWLTQKLMADLFQVTVSTINEHIKNIFNERELIPDATVRKFRIVQKEGRRNVTRMVDYYNLDMIISVGYRVKSLIATRFRIWATQRLNEYVVKGFVMNDDRLKNPPVKGSAVPDRRRLRARFPFFVLCHCYWNRQDAIDGRPLTRALTPSGPKDKTDG